MSKNTPENLLKKLRRLDSNMTCPNCDTPAQAGIGFGNVCVKFKTFVCDMCKTSHQAISHRVKSITMSNWTMEEVMELSGEQSGGNEACRQTWLANAPKCGTRYPGGARPKQGDKIENFKQFVLDAYDYGKFKSNAPYVHSGESHGIANVEKKVVRDVEAKPAGLKIQTPASTRPAPQAEVDLLGGFDAPAPFNNNSNFNNTSSQGAAFDPFGDSFSGTATPNSPWSNAANNNNNFSAPAPAVPTSNSSQDLFANFGAPQAATSNTGSTFDMFSSQNNSPIPSHHNSTNDFGLLLSQPSTPPPVPTVAANTGFDPFGNDDLTLLKPASSNNNANNNNGWNNSPARPINGMGMGNNFNNSSSNSLNSFNSLNSSSNNNLSLLPPAAPMRSTSTPMSSMMGNNAGSNNVMGGNMNYGANSPMGSGYRPGGNQPMMGGGSTMNRPMGGAAAISNLNNFTMNNNNAGSGKPGQTTTNSFDFVQAAMNQHLGSPAPSSNGSFQSMNSSNNNSGRFNAMGGASPMGSGYQPQQQYRTQPPPNPFSK